MQLSADEKTEAVELLNKLRTIYENKIDLELSLKEKELRLKDDFAQACDIRNKKGEPQPSKVKTALMTQTIIDVIEKEKENKYEAQVDEIETYKNAFPSINTDTAKAFLTTKNEIDDVKNQIKDVTMDTSLLSGEYLTALLAIAKDEYTSSKRKAFEDAGYKAAKNDNEAIDKRAIIDEMLEALK